MSIFSRIFGKDNRKEKPSVSMITDNGVSSTPTWNLARVAEGKESRVTSTVVSPSGTGMVQPPQRYDVFAKETYLKNIISFGCIVTIARSFASVPWELFKRVSADKKDLVDSHWVVDLLKRPNPDDSFAFIVLRLIAFLVLAGNSFLERVALMTGPNSGTVKELYVHRPDRMKILLNPKNGQVRGYQYHAAGRPAEPWERDPITGHCDLLHLKTFHPINDWWGASVTEPAAREIDTSNAATDWNKSLLDNQGRPGMVYVLVGQVGDKYFEQLERKLREEHTGPTNAGKNIIITGERGTKVEPYAWSPTDMDFINAHRESARRIAYAYGVPSILLGIPGDTIYSTYKEARLDFWETTIIWYLNYIRGELNNWLFTSEREQDKDLFLDYSLDDIPALAPRREVMWKRAQESDFLSINQKRELVGYENIGPAGDVVLIDANKIPLTSVGEGKEKEEETEKHIADEEELAIQDLMDDGYSREEAESLVSIASGNSDEFADIEGLPDGVVPTDGKPAPNEWA